jgi:type III restriction enzyme
MKFHFDSNQSYQLEAVKSVTDLFEGQPLNNGDFSFSSGYGSINYHEEGFGNNLLLTEEQIRKNLQQVQLQNNITTNTEQFHGMHFTVEMETGTGKTYVYLRTIYELNKLYNFKKFIIVVPSIAIREGVLKNLEITHQHFQTIYDNAPINFSVYDAKNVSALRSFASSTAIQILVINIDSFAKDDNIINKANDKLTGKRPIEFIQNCNPIIIVDEPQNMETDNRKKAIENLNPLFTLRYSATHSNLYNLVYSLNPVKAYDLGLVKQIEVDSVLTQNNLNNAFIQLEKIVPSKTKLSVKLKIDVNTNKSVSKKSITAKVGDDLYKLSNNREIYKEGFIIEDIDATEGIVMFTNGITIREGSTMGGMTDELMQYMIKKTVEEHLRKERLFLDKGIKVLSLFFIDRVANYREYDENGIGNKGKFAQWFEEIYETEINKPINVRLRKLPADEVHDGYFSSDTKKRFKDTGGETQADDDTYRLIMQEKERLLDINTPLKFIFSHSALREGWDNPNVFQICTLNETKSEIKKRQEIGRGLRLPVDQYGQRIFDKNINRLTIIANESYEDFAKALQQEIAIECGVDFSGRIKDARQRKKISYRKNFEVDPRFIELWDKIKQKCRYRVSYNTQHLIELASTAMKDRMRMPETKKAAIVSTKKKLIISESGIESELLSNSNIEHEQVFDIPDILGYVQQKTGLTRNTILQILKQSNRIDEVFINPQLFMDNAVVVINSELEKLMIDGIKYEQINDQVFEMSLFDQNEIDIWFNPTTDHIVRNPEKTIYEEIIPLDSTVEKEFAKDCETSLNVEFYFKLPPDFKIQTPIGTYNPDWAVVHENEKKAFFIVETKGKDQELRGSENLKIKCGLEYFKSLKGISYIRAYNVSEIG